jgi:16S rRNA (uracil1498-N3)-methyltransferase
MPVFLISSQSIQDGTIHITDPLLDHLRASLRVNPGEELWFGDERRRRYRTRILEVSRKVLRGQVIEERVGPVPYGPPITLALALLKGDRMEWVLQKATELGVARMIALLSRRTVIRPRAERLPTRHERWHRIAWEASQQAERWDVPEVVGPLSAEEFFTAPSTALRLILKERDAGQSLQALELPRGPETAIVLAVGPEGGWASQEALWAHDGGFVPVTLGQRILRAETAALAALSILQSRLGELG